MPVNLKRVEEIADAVLYEGYMLYPYRPSSLKNQQRFNFGVLYPQSWCESQSASDSHSLQAECLLRASAQTQLTIKVRFLQLRERLVQRCGCSGIGDFVTRLEVDDRVWQPWQEAEEQDFTLNGIKPASLEDRRSMQFSLPASESVEALRKSSGEQIGQVIRRSTAIAGSLDVSVEKHTHNIIKLRVLVQNRSQFDMSGRHLTRDAALAQSFICAHLILALDDGEFISLLEPPADLDDLARCCRNIGVWPVLAGENTSVVLASPIILYDYPQIASESVGNLFDATEIDEILSLRILTLTEEERAEVRQSDDRARLALERTEQIPNDQFMKLHGVLRGYALSERVPDE